jgi:hypothetical protein
MKNHNPAGRKLRFAGTGQRILALLVFVVLGYLIWLAYTGRYDREVNRFAGWLSMQWRALVN